MGPEGRVKTLEWLKSWQIIWADFQFPKRKWKWKSGGPHYLVILLRWWLQTGHKVAHFLVSVLPDLWLVTFSIWTSPTLAATATLSHSPGLNRKADTTLSSSGWDTNYQHVRLSGRPCRSRVANITAPCCLQQKQLAATHNLWPRLISIPSLQLSPSGAWDESAVHTGGASAFCNRSVSSVAFLSFGFIGRARRITLGFSGCSVLITNVALPWHFTFPAGMMSERL